MLTDLKNKIEKLKSLYESVNSEKKTVIKENNELQAIIKTKNDKIKELEKRIETLQLANAFTAASTEKQEAKQRIGRIVREIEKCIAMLNN
jgi:predicted nuclease with TOPRIM domain